MFLLLFFYLFHFTVFNCIFLNYFKNSMKRTKSSQINTAMASGAIKRSAQENVGCTQDSMLSVTYFLYQPFLAKKQYWTNVEQKTVRCTFVKQLSLIFNPFVFDEDLSSEYCFLYHTLIVRAFSCIHAAMFFLAFYYKERILLSDVRFTYYRLITQKSTT